MTKRTHLNLKPKPLFEERLKKLMPNKEDYEKFMQTIKKPNPNYIRCNTLKISPEKLKNKLEKRGWQIEQPFNQHEQIMIIKSKLQPGELGKATEHLLGYYYVQEPCSMMPLLALSPKPDEIFLDLCAAPGSKTTQASAIMENTGIIIANDKVLGRIKILVSNLERCSCSNVITTKNDGVQLCKKLDKLGFKFDKILVDAPCSGEGTLRSSPKTFLIWNLKMINKISRQQKLFAASALKLLKVGGEMIYSTCTHAPEENEAVVDFLIKNFNIQVEKISLPLKCRRGITSWENETYNSQVQNACRIYPQDNDTEGFFIAKIKKLEGEGK